MTVVHQISKTPSLKTPVLLFGIAECPVLPGGLIVKPRKDAWLTAEAQGKLYLVLDGGTHWILERAERVKGNKTQTLRSREDLETKAIPKCPDCQSFGYVDGKLCYRDECGAGATLLLEAKLSMVQRLLGRGPEADAMIERLAKWDQAAIEIVEAGIVKAKQALRDEFGRFGEVKLSERKLGEVK